jgi:hypothetical protein
MELLSNNYIRYGTRQQEGVYEQTEAPGTKDRGECKEAWRIFEACSSNRLGNGK